MESKYLSQFVQVKDKYKLRGNRILVEVLPREEIKSAGGLILAAPPSDHRSTLDSNRACLAVVLAVGDGYYDDDTGEDSPLDIEVGNVIMLSAYGMRLYSTFPGVVDYVPEHIALIRDSDVTQAWKSKEDYEQYKQGLASGARKNATA